MFNIIEVKDLIHEDRKRLNALIACGQLLEDQDNLDLVENVMTHIDTIRDIVEDQKRLEKVCKRCKEITEPALWLCRNEANEVKDVRGRKLFTFSKVGTTAKITDIQGLFERMMQSNIPPEKILEGCSITPKAAAEVLGLSEKAFEETFAEFLEFSERKPTMKAI